MLLFFRFDTKQMQNIFTNNADILLSVSIIGLPSDDGYRFFPETQTGKNFADMVDTIISNNDIQKLTLLNTAYLQRHRIELELIADGVNSEEAKKSSCEIALSNRDLWNKENEDSISKLRERFGANFKILDWYALLASDKENFDYKMKRVLSLYEDKGNKDFKKATNGLTEIFFKKLPAVIQDKIILALKKKAVALRYLRNIAFEEAVMRTMLSYDFEIYRGLSNIPANMIYHRLGVSGKMIPVSIGTEEEIQHCKNFVTTNEDITYNNMSEVKKEKVELSPDCEITIIKVKTSLDKVDDWLRKFGFFGSLNNLDEKNIKLVQVFTDNDNVDNLKSDSVVIK